MKKISLEDALILNTVRFARFLVHVLPLGVSFALARLMGWATFRLSKRRDIAIKNLRRVFAGQKSRREIRRIAEQSFLNMGMSMIEMLRIPDMNTKTVEKYFQIVGKPNFEPYVKRGQGIIFLTGHFGSWEMLNIVSGLVGYPMAALARVQKHPRSDAYLNSLRRSKGSQVIHKGMPIREILKALKEGRIVGILSDQDGGKQGRFINFFGRSSSTPPGAATFSLRTGAPIFPSFIVRLKGPYHRIIVEKPIEFPDPSLSPEEAERAMLQEYANALESLIRQYPEQWLWAHRRWKSSPDRVVTVLSDGKAGHWQQSMAVAEALKRQRRQAGVSDDQFILKTVEVRFAGPKRQRLWKALGFLFGGRPPFAERLLPWVLSPESADAVMNTYADIVISCGASLVELNLWMKKENSAKSIVVMRPDVGSRSFDAVIVPRHDRLRPAKNVFMTDGALSALRPEQIDLESRWLSEKLSLTPGVLRVGVLLGGDTADVKFDPAVLEKQLIALRAFCEANHAQVLLTTSRRTPVWAESIVRDLFSDRNICPHLVIASRSNPTGTVPAILGASTILLVTGESMSMISEAVSSGKPVCVFHPCQKSVLKKKYLQSLAHWQEEGRLVQSETGRLQDALSQVLSSATQASLSHREEEDRVLNEAARRVF